jgi:Rrf2 family protein
VITKTTLTAVRTLVYLGKISSEVPIAPRKIASELDESPTYLAKVAGILVKAGILRSHRGVAGGVTLSRSPSEVSLLEIVEACEGLLVAGYCQDHPDPQQVCGFHHAMMELHAATVEVLSRWTLADLVARPHPSPAIADLVDCRLGISL